MFARGSGVRFAHRHMYMHGWAHVHAHTDTKSSTDLDGKQAKALPSDVDDGEVWIVWIMNGFNVERVTANHCWQHIKVQRVLVFAAVVLLVLNDEVRVRGLRHLRTHLHTLAQGLERSGGSRVEVSEHLFGYYPIC